MSGAAIVTEDISKNFRVYRSPADMVLEVLTGRPRHQDFTALENVSFTVERGEVVGLIGRNGAGKSTLLKIIAGTLEQSAGRIEVNGRVSAILELGTGFNPEYTGRENIYLGGLCLGLTRDEIANCESEIIAFSELEEFIDRPFKTYSSGMQARLTFSVAVSINPDILIIDEALSVGDAKFQRKCFRKFEEFRSDGCTILFVTHQTGVVEAICDRAIYMAAGKVVLDGMPRDVVGQYLKDMFGAEKAKTKDIAEAQVENNEDLRYGTGEVTIVDCGIVDKTGQRISIVNSGENYQVCCDLYCNAENVDDLNVGISITTIDGVRLLAANSALHRCPIPRLVRDDKIRINLDLELNLGLGDYFITVGAWGTFAEQHYDRRVDVLHIVVKGPPLLSASLINMKQHYTVSLLETVEHGQN